MMKLEETYLKWKTLLPLSPEQERLLSRKFTIEYNYNSNHIEGNTLTYGQTELLLLFGKITGDSSVKDYADMKASQVGVEMVKEAVQNSTMPLTQNFIRQLHKIILREDYTIFRELPNAATTSYTVHAGQYKTRPNSVITRYGDRFEYASPEETPALMTDLVDWFNIAEHSDKYSPVELAALFHYRYIRIHPFEDGNGRIARLLTNYILARHGWPMIVVRNRNKAEYIEALHKSDMAVGAEPVKGAHATLLQAKHFVQYFGKMVQEEIQSNIDIIDNIGNETWWYDGQMIKFRTETSKNILRLMQDNPFVTYKEMSETTGVNISALQKMIDRMKQKGYLERQSKENCWYVFAISTKNLQ